MNKTNLFNWIRDLALSLPMLAFVEVRAQSELQLQLEILSDDNPFTAVLDETRSDLGGRIVWEREAKRWVTDRVAPNDQLRISVSSPGHPDSAVKQAVYWIAPAEKIRLQQEKVPFSTTHRIPVDATGGQIEIGVTDDFDRKITRRIAVGPRPRLRILRSGSPAL